MKLSPMLQVADVAASSRWFQQTLGLVSGHGGDEYEMLFAGEPYVTPLLLQLHRWDAHEHGFLGSADIAVGNGVSLWFEVLGPEQLAERWQAVEAAGAVVLAAPAWNPQAHHHEFTVRDPNGYVVVVNTPFEMTPEH
jgi:catechol 2,3-dioxygenase-like lactoylglutathione lyase family enzyme